VSAAALLVISDLRCGTWVRMGAENGGDVNIPSAICASADCRRLQDHVNRLGAVRLLVQPSALTKPYDNLASFSSRGPTSDGRYKPEVVAPGQGIKSAAVPVRTEESQSKCQSKVLSGTSMATPIAAGGGALVHQYLRNASRFFTNATDMQLERANPSGQLVKALLINGAQPMEGFAEQGVDTIPLESVPSCEQGFGRVNLSSSLPLDDVGGSPPFLELVDDGTFSSSDDNPRVFCYEASGPGELRATLTWADEAWENNQIPKELINDIDLTVEATSNATFPIGNADHTNTVERVIVPQLEAGIRIAVEVAPVNISTYQDFSLVVSGNVMHVRENSGPLERSTCASEGSTELPRSALRSGSLSNLNNTNSAFEFFTCPSMATCKLQNQLSLLDFAQPSELAGEPLSETSAQIKQVQSSSSLLRARYGGSSIYERL